MLSFWLSNSCHFLNCLKQYSGEEVGMLLCSGFYADCESSPDPPNSEFLGEWNWSPAREEPHSTPVDWWLVCSHTMFNIHLFTNAHLYICCVLKPWNSRLSHYIYLRFVYVWICLHFFPWAFFESSSPLDNGSRHCHLVIQWHLLRKKYMLPPNIPQRTQSIKDLRFQSIGD